MKMIKVSDVAHADLKARSIVTGQSISALVDELISGESKRTDLDIVLDQLVIIQQLLDAHILSSEVRHNGMIPPLTGIHALDSGEPKIETRQERFLRIKAENEERERAQRHAIDHPEDSDQSGGW